MKPFFWPVRVYWEDTDAGGVVYHASYLRFMERARTEWLRSLGLNQQNLADTEGRQFVVKTMDIDFVAPARLDDQLAVKVQATRFGRVVMRMEQAIQRDSDGQMICLAKVKAGCLDAATLAPAPLPQQLYRELNNEQ